MLTTIKHPAPVAATNNFDTEGYDATKPSRRSLDYQMEKPIPNMSHAAMNFAPKLDWANQTILGQKANIGGDYLVAGPGFPSKDFVTALQIHRQGRECYVAGVYVCQSQQQATEVLWSLITAHYGIQ